MSTLKYDNICVLALDASNPATAYFTKARRSASILDLAGTYPFTSETLSKADIALDQLKVKFLCAKYSFFNLSINSKLYKPQI